MTKRWLAVIVLLLCVMLMFHACGNQEPKQEEEIDLVGNEPLPQIDGPLHEGTDIASSPFVGTFQNTYSALFASLTAEVFEDASDIPSLTCNADGTFEMKVTDYTTRAAHILSGTFTVDGEIATFTATNVGEIASVSGTSVTFTMQLINENEMKYGGDELDCVTKGDIFTRAGAA